MVKIDVWHLSKELLPPLARTFAFFELLDRKYLTRFLRTHRR